MPVRLRKPYLGQAANTLFWAGSAVENDLLASGVADTMLDQASDYQELARIVIAATASTSRNARVYRMNSVSGQTLTVQQPGYLVPGDVLTVIQEGAGAVTVVGASGVTINTALSSLVTKGQWNVGQLVYRGSNLFVAVGGFGG